MSLDFVLFMKVDAGAEEPEETTFFSGNMTHNVSGMWTEAGCYDALYNSDGLEANACIPFLEKGLADMLADKAKYEKMNPPNGWGSYTSALGYLTEVLAACKRYPKATIYISK